MHDSVDAIRRTEIVLVARTVERPFIAARRAILFGSSQESVQRERV